MAVVPSNPIEGVLEHITIIEYIETTTNTVRMRALYAHEGYAIYDKTQNVGCDENGVPYPPTYSYTARITPTTPVSNYAAKLIDDTMHVVGVPAKPSKAEVM